MILRRLAQAIQRQDWFVVFLELMIVVVGIYIGLQVDDWNRARQERALEQVYLERLLEDMTGTIADFNANLHWDKDRLTTQQLVLDSLRAGELAPEDEASFETGIAYAGLHNPIQRRWGTVEELKSTGNIALIRDLELRSAISLSESYYERSLYLIRNSAAQISQRRGVLAKHVDIQTFSYGKDDNISATVEFDFESLAANREFIGAFSDIQLASDILVTFALNYARGMTMIRNNLAEKLGQDIAGLPSITITMEELYPRPDSTVTRMVPQFGPQVTGD